MNRVRQARRFKGIRRERERERERHGTKEIEREGPNKKTVDPTSTHASGIRTRFGFIHHTIRGELEITRE
jgi:hypothetical protein